MRIGVDGSCWANRRGFGRFTRGTVSALAELVGAEHELVMVLDDASLADPDLPALPASADVVVARVREAPARAAAAEGSRGLRDVLAMTAAARRARCDVFWFPASYSWFPVVGTPVVVTLHDAIAETLPDLVLPTRGDRLRWHAKQRLALRQSASVVTVSEASRQALVQELGVDPARLHVVREATDPVFAPVAAAERQEALTRLGLGDDPSYVLYVGGISPHKNLLMLVDAFARTTTPDLQLVLVGDADDDPFLSSGGSVRSAARDSPASARIRFTGYVTDAELAALYSGAVATAQPSLSEGFGLTAAESAACGTPVVASQDPALQELLGPAGRYADARDPAAWAVVLDRLATDPSERARAAAACSDLAASWSWAATARDLLPVLTAAAGRG